MNSGRNEIYDGSFLPADGIVKNQKALGRLRNINYQLDEHFHCSRKYVKIDLVSCDIGN